MRMCIWTDRTTEVRAVLHVLMPIIAEKCLNCSQCAHQTEGKVQANHITQAYSLQHQFPVDTEDARATDLSPLLRDAEQAGPFD